MDQVPQVNARTEIRDDMRITWHQPIPMDDGIVLRADLFRPVEDGRYPIICLSLLPSYFFRGLGNPQHKTRNET